MTAPIAAWMCRDVAETVRNLLSVAVSVLLQQWAPASRVGGTHLLHFFFHYFT